MIPARGSGGVPRGLRGTPPLSRRGLSVDGTRRVARRSVRVS
ncbi:hypothetical protein FM113_10530 [Leucobacter sp. 7(1)]|nr:hypothetical protein FM113_10530 [Leucobacter sp. 7(1)]